MRTAEELMAVAEPAWPSLQRELMAAEGMLEILPVAPELSRECLLQLQVTARSRLGALALHTGGLLIDYGWLRVFGGGMPELSFPSIAEVNGLDGSPGDAPPSFAVGFDILGGQFEVNGPEPSEDRPGGPGEICYFAPDTLVWEPLGFGYGAWLSWLATGATAHFYESLRWPTWREESEALGLDEGLSVYPFLCTSEAKADLAATDRRAVPIGELLALNDSLAEQLADTPDGGSFAVGIDEQ